MTDPIQPELKDVLRRLKLGRLLDTLPERFALARAQKMRIRCTAPIFRGEAALRMLTA